MERSFTNGICLNYSCWWIIISFFSQSLQPTIHNMAVFFFRMAVVIDVSLCQHCHSTSTCRAPCVLCFIFIRFLIVTTSTIILWFLLPCSIALEALAFFIELLGLIFSISFWMIRRKAALNSRQISQITHTHTHWQTEGAMIAVRHALFSHCFHLCVLANENGWFLFSWDDRWSHQ